MIQNYSRYRILQAFFDAPRKQFHMRELSRLVKLAQPSVLHHLKALVKEGFILKETNSLYPTYTANQEQPAFRLLKQQNIVWRLHTSGLLEFLDGKIKPTCIVLFGSASRGEDTEKSDIDLFVQAEESALELGIFEKSLKRRIHPLFEPELSTVNKELLNNIINGQVLYGYLKVF